MKTTEQAITGTGCWKRNNTNNWIAQW